MVETSSRTRTHTAMIGPALPPGQTSCAKQPPLCRASALVALNVRWTRVVKPKRSCQSMQLHVALPQGSRQPSTPPRPTNDDSRCTVEAATEGTLLAHLLGSSETAAWPLSRGAVVANVAIAFAGMGAKPPASRGESARRCVCGFGVEVKDALNQVEKARRHSTSAFALFCAVDHARDAVASRALGLVQQGVGRSQPFGGAG